MTTSHLLFEAGGLSLAIPANLVKAIHEDLPIQTVAGTRSWFRGLAVAHGKLLPLTDIGAFAGRRSSSGRTLELSPAVGISGLLVDRVIGLSNSSVADIAFDEDELRPTGGGNLALSLRAIMHDQKIHRLVDVAALVQSPFFLNIAETSH
jgi:chemotaxis signal transduction protein